MLYQIGIGKFPIPFICHIRADPRQPDIDKIVRLQKSAYIAVKFPKTLPFIKRLIRYDMPKLSIIFIGFLILFYTFVRCCKQIG